MTDREWIDFLKEQTSLAEAKYNEAVSVLAKTNPPYSDEMILNYLIAKENWRITGLRRDCALTGHRLSDFIH